MPRKTFIQDLAALQVKGAVDKCIADIHRGDDDGSFVFTFVPLGSSARAGGIQITGFVPELADYPGSHQCFIYAIAEDAPSWATSALERIQEKSSGQPLPWLLNNVAASLTKAMEEAISRPGDSSDSRLDDSEMESPCDDDESDDDSGDDVSVGGWEEKDNLSHAPDAGSDIEMTDSDNPQGASKKRKRLTANLKADLRQAQAAGFKVAVEGDFKGGMDFYVSLSIRISRLGISDEAMNAWGLEPTNYLILLIHYSNYYQDLAKLATKYHVRESVTMRVGTSDYYKLPPGETFRAFSRTREIGPSQQVLSSKEGDPQPSGSAIGSEVEKESSFTGLFISRPLNELLNSRLFHVLEYRLKFGLGWDGAEMLSADLMAHEKCDSDRLGEKHYQPSEPRTALTPIVAGDALLGAVKWGESVSFPLLGMQFALRHLVRCTEFCLVCHTKITRDYEALKPYVCSSPLCLYQYMALGFGPSIEYEIMSQPTVVDLLVSFCYYSALAGNLQEFPVGMDLLAPSSMHNRVTYSTSRDELCFTDFCALNTAWGLKVGGWVMVNGHPTDGRGGQEVIHLRVLDISGFPAVKVGAPVRIGQSTQQLFTPSNAAAPDSPSSRGGTVKPLPDPMPGDCFIYNVQFDACGVKEKHDAILAILDTLPSVLEMRAWLQRYSKASQETSLKNWAERISPSALGVLRWIIASNRSCIIPVDQVLDQEGGVSPAPKGGKGCDRRIPGADGWLQFRFAMGAPDKEQRFVNCVRDAQQRLDLKYPTLFAFHGSSLANWHSIIREGLHFRKVANGRAYGDGCYHSLDIRTSMGYSSTALRPYGRSFRSSWPHSILDIKSVISLNEIVNAPGEFVSKSPHLVVAQLDWIQTRYLLVQTAVSKDGSTHGRLEKVAQPHPQDPKYTPSGLAGPLVIPSLASAHRSKPPRPSPPPLLSTPRPPPRGAATRHPSVTRLMSAAAERNLSDKTKEDWQAFSQTMIKIKNSKRGDPPEAPVVTGDGAPGDDSSDTTETTDIMELFSDDEDASPGSADPSPLGFKPGTLDTTGITFLEPPTYASNLATKRLTNDLANLIKLQKAHPLPELGFYIDPNRVDNVYQWVVELHSFPPTLPLSQDMASMGVKSIVLEIRFGPSYPMSPPFVRVVKPRFRGYAQGGGGHVTIGGALCMELLTNSGWSAVSSVESVLVQVRMAIGADDPPARLEPRRSGVGGCYGVAEAREAYVRACRNHGWKIPDDFERMA